MFYPVLMAGSSHTSSGDISFDIVVSENGSVSSIQEAIDMASADDVIFIMNGSYVENLVIDKSITLIGEHNASTIIDGRQAGNVIKINAEHVILQDLTIKHSGMVFPSAGINLSASYSLIENMIITDNFYGMILYDAHYNNIRNNMIQDNTNCGIYMVHSTNNFFRNNTVSNQTYNGFGIYDSSDHNVITNNTFSRNSYCGINIRISSNNTVIGNMFLDNNIGIHTPSSGNIVEDNMFSKNNKAIDEELEVPVPGFEILIMLISFMIIIIYKSIR